MSINPCILIGDSRENLEIAISILREAFPDAAMGPVKSYSASGLFLMAATINNEDGQAIYKFNNADGDLPNHQGVMVTLDNDIIAVRALNSV